jgi:hypothetical protein
MCVHAFAAEPKDTVPSVPVDEEDNKKLSQIDSAIESSQFDSSCSSLNPEVKRCLILIQLSLAQKN